MKDTADIPIEVNGADTMKKILKQTAFAAGGLAIGYTAFRIYQASHSEFHEREKELMLWLSRRLDDLENTLGITKDQRSWLEDELAPVIKSANRACRKMEKLAPAILDELTLEIEEKFLKLKQHAHKTLKLVEDTHLKALHEFYEEFRQRFFGLHPDIVAETKMAAESVADDSACCIVTD